MHIFSLRDEEEPEPWELTVRGGFDREEAFDMEEFEDVPEEMGEQLLSRMGPPWRSPRNMISEKLTRIGEGKKVEVAYLHEGKEAKSTITLELGLPDFENAKRYQSEELGLTVKNLTYEVRTHYRLKPDSAGVVVAKVEPGTKATVAKVLPLEVLVAVGGKPVRTTSMSFSRRSRRPRRRPARTVRSRFASSGWARAGL